jgi:endonuclease/exonuclease/phosphatase family metal-dependent hydrolase
MKMNREERIRPKKSDRPAVALVLVAVLALLFGSLGPGNHPERPAGEAPSALTVLSFNIRYDNPADGPNAWPNRKDLVAKTILFHEAGLVGMQEALRGQVADLESLLPGFGWFGVGRDDGREGGEFNPIFYRRDRFRLMSQSTFWLSATPAVAGSRGWDAACNRIVTWGEFEDLISGARFFLFNTHFDHRGPVARRESAGLLLRKVAEIAGDVPLVVTGDFNCVAADEPFRILRAGVENGPALLDSRELSQTGSYGGSSSFNGFKEETVSGTIIDHIFVRNAAAVTRHGILADRADGRFVSDHYPVLAGIVLK